MPISTSSKWPVLTSYPQDRLRAIGMPLGGIGTGCVSLGGRGQLRDWEIVNRPAKGFSPRQRLGSATFFAIWLKAGDGEPQALSLEGTIDQADYEGFRGSEIPNHGLPHWRECSFHAAYPFGQVCLSDPAVPASVRIEAFNPLIPGDADASGMPFAALRFVVANESESELEASICGSLDNFIGTDGNRGQPDANRNRFRQGDGFQGIYMDSEGVAPGSEQWGTMALVTTAPECSYRTAWPNPGWGNYLLDFWDEFAADGKIADRPAEESLAVGSLAVPLKVAPGKEASVTFLLSWHFPNRLTWDMHRMGADCCADGDCGCGQPSDCCAEDDGCCEGTGNPDWIGNHYATRFGDAWEAGAAAVGQLDELERRSLEFVGAFLGTDLPGAVKEAALFNLSTLKSQTCFRTADGRFYGWEGCNDAVGCCPGSCTHVWNYEQALAYLFGDLARSMREVEFAHATDAEGKMSFRVMLPLEGRATEFVSAAADGQLGCVMKLYREWRLSGDDDFLAELWPHCKRALEYCWVEGGWDGDRDGVMEGCQHNTMDVEYFGPNPQMQGWYLGALRAAEEMARHLGERDFAEKCRRLFEAGSAWSDANLFNGEYYEHQIVPIGDPAEIAPGLRIESMGARDVSDPDLQLGPGCLVDQLVGQFFAHLNGLGYLLSPENVAATHAAIMRHNFRRSFFHHFNHARTYVLNDEQALLMATWPRGGRPKRPFPYANEVMTGFEYTAAVGMILEGQLASGLEVIEAVRARYDGRRRNPFDEAECGHHYARAMASWGAVLALSGYQYCGVSRQMRFAAREQFAFWSNGSAFGRCRISANGEGWEVELGCSEGRLDLEGFELDGAGAAELSAPLSISAGASVTLRVA
ncbi:MAG: GH116 family glycosyl-hydrolase [Chloroflexi bacterium]|nr:GH116 family glycosyl-hydrolase [Chloroflexota bacterium]